MTVPVNLHMYPQAYFNLFRKALNEPVFIKLNSKDEAVKLRAILYGFRKSLQAKATTASEVELATISSRLTFSCKENGLLVEDRQVSVATQQIQVALDTGVKDDFPTLGEILDETQLPDPN